MCRQAYNMRLMKPLLLCLLPLLSQGSLAASYTINLKAIGAEADQGQILCALFSSSENYLKDSVRDAVVTVDGNGEAQCKFSDVPPGRYAVSVVYDADNDGELDTGFLGIPKEKVGFTNNVKGRFGPPGFDKTSFELSEDLELEVRLTEARQ
jgi:uncharacterized protein (DUF2141 family)